MHNLVFGVILLHFAYSLFFYSHLPKFGLRTLQVGKEAHGSGLRFRTNQSDIHCVSIEPWDLATLERWNAVHHLMYNGPLHTSQSQQTHDQPSRTPSLNFTLDSVYLFDKARTPIYRAIPCSLLTYVETTIPTCAAELSPHRDYQRRIKRRETLEIVWYLCARRG